MSKVDPRSGSKKDFLYKPSPIHNGMTRQQQDVAGVGGLRHGVSGVPDASGPLPLDPSVPGKRLTAPAPVIGHRSRTGRTFPELQQLGQRILAEAHAVAGPDHPANFGKLPDRTSE